MTSFKQVVYRRFDLENPHAVHELSEASLPARIPDDKVLVHMRSAPVHPCDTACAMGLINGVALPAVGGTEGVGVIEDLGESLTGSWRKGQRVHVAANYIFGDWVTWQGVWSEYVLCPENALIAVPDGVDDDTAAQFLVNPLTAYAMVKEMDLGPGNVLLQTAAGSVLGQLMIQLSKLFDFTTVNLVRRQATADELRERYGVQTVYVYDGTETSRERTRHALAKDLPDQRIDRCIEAVGEDTASFCLDLLGPDGDMYIYGVMTGNPMLSVNTVADIVMKNNALKGWSTQETWLRKTSDATKRARVAELWQLMAGGKLELPPAGQRYGLSEIRDAMVGSFQPGRSGKIMLDCTA